jgi:hypothetical protein
VERWTVKTLQDRPRLLPVRSTTIAFLVSRPAPSSVPATRLPFERHVFGMINMSTTVSGEPGPADNARSIAATFKPRR